MFNKYIYGGDNDKESFSFYADFEANHVNQNLNIDLPVFIIHGNHDYPNEQFEHLSSLDLLKKANFLNYFGKISDYENILIKPILFEKNGCTIAIYGIGHIKDVRLHNLFENKQIKFKKPK